MIWNNLYKAKQITLQNFGKGLNTDEDQTKIDPEELTDCVNVTCDDYPIIRTRNDRVLENAEPTTNPLGIGSRGSGSTALMMAWDNNSWRYRDLATSSWNIIASSTAALSGFNQVTFHEFRTYSLTTAASTGDRITYTLATVSNSSNTQNAYWDGASTFSFLTTSYTEPSSGSTYTNYPPQSNLLAVHKYRVYGFDHDLRTLRYSELGNPLWYKAGNYLDITEMRGQAKAITAYADHIIVWGENSMHELYGESPFNFELINISNDVGCIGKLAHTECKGRLYWMCDKGFYMYTGGIPRQFGMKAKKYFDEINWDVSKIIAMGTYGNKIYTAVPIKPSTTNNKLIVIDIEKMDYGLELVTIEDVSFLRAFSNIDKTLYGIHGDGRIWDMCSTYKTGFDNSTAISWSFETSPLTDEQIQTLSAISEIWVEHQGSTSAGLYLKYSTNSHSTTFSTFMATSDFTTNSTSILRDSLQCSSTELQDFSYVKFQFSGTGYKKLYGMYARVLTFGDIK